MVKPIPSLKKPTATLPLDAMASFVSGQAETAPPATGAAPRLVEDPVAPPVPDGGGETPQATATVHSLEGAKAAAPRRSVKPQQKGGRRLETRSDGTLSRKVTFYLDPELDRQLSIHAVTKGLDRSVLVAEALARFLKKDP